jgi:hypothetical protein
MVLTYSRPGNSIKTLSLNQTLPKVNHTEIVKIAYSVFAFVSALLLIGLGLRVVMALLFVSGPFARGLTIFTDPFVLPFDHIFNDAHSMVQASTSAAFTSFYFFYLIVSNGYSFLSKRVITTRSFKSI